METQVSSWGNSLGVRIPKALAKKLGITSGSRMEVLLERGRLVLSPLEAISLETMAGNLDLKGMTSRITADNRPDRVADEPDVEGNEIW